jgi:hypothetical protein
MTTRQPIACPRRTPWCTDHEDELDQCVSSAIHVSSSCHVWMVCELPGLEPTIIIDGRTSGAELTFQESLQLIDAMARLKQAAMLGTAVQR